MPNEAHCSFPRNITAHGRRKNLGHANDRGSIEPEKLSTLVVLAGNPLGDVPIFPCGVLSLKRARRFPRTDFIR